MAFRSILFANSSDSTMTAAIESPACFVDLNLDQIIDSITASKQEYDLKPFFYTPLQDIDSIQYRHEVMQDLDDETMLQNIKLFSQKMALIRRYSAMLDKLYYKYHQEGWFLEVVDLYCEAVESLAADLSRAGLKSRGFSGLYEYLSTYTTSDAYQTLIAETKKLKLDLSSVKYCVSIKNSTVRVRRFAAEIDYSFEVEKTFEKFKQGAVKDYLVQLPPQSGMNHVEARILDFVARLYPDIFNSLDQFYARHRNFMDATITGFDREIQFYVAYLEYIARMKRVGLKFCYPSITCKDKEVYDDEGFDLALAHKLISENSPIICNDFYLEGKERIIVVTGPNQGGKTTFARTFGQLHYLASLGCPVPGRRAQLFLFDRIFTHFEKEEDIKNLSGKLQNDLVRISAILDQLTTDSILILNEIFTSTTVNDAGFLSFKILDRINQEDLLCVWVTFLDELASSSEKTVSMVSTVLPENPDVRTFKVVRMPPNGLAYAISIAEKYRLTYESVRERIQS